MHYKGNNKVTLDSKARLAIPTRHREPLMAQCGGKLVITLGKFDQALLLPEPVWEKILVQLEDMDPSHPTRTSLVMNAEDVEMDSGGRILMPASLRERGLFPNSSLAFMGNLSHFEVWDWDARMAKEASERAQRQQGWDSLRF